MRAEKEPHVRVQGIRALGGDESESGEGGGGDDEDEDKDEEDIGEGSRARSEEVVDGPNGETVSEGEK